MRKLRVTPKAKRDLIGIGRYTEQTRGVRQRKTYLKELVKRFDRLTKYPELGRNRKDLKEGYYSYHQGNHVVFYTFDDTALNIIGILHESMDFKRHL